MILNEPFSHRLSATENDTIYTNYIIEYERCVTNPVAIDLPSGF